MAAWLVPVIKSILPHVGTITSAAAPVFTSKRGDVATLHQQVSELQSAASANDANIKNLAVQMQSAIEALEKGTRLAEKGYRNAMLLGIASFIISLTALGLVMSS